MTRRHSKPDPAPTAPAPVTDTPEESAALVQTREGDELPPADPEPEPAPSPFPKGPPVLTIVMGVRTLLHGPDDPDTIERVNLVTADLPEAFAAARRMVHGSILAVEHAGEVIWKREDGSPLVYANQRPDSIFAGAADAGGYGHADALAEVDSAARSDRTRAGNTDAYSPPAVVDAAPWRLDKSEVPVDELDEYELELQSNPDPCSFSVFATVTGRDVQDAKEAPRNGKPLRAIRKNGEVVWSAGDGEHQD